VYNLPSRFLLFSFIAYRPPRDLPSFPTRRSSDLQDEIVGGSCLGGAQRELARDQPVLGRLDLGAGGAEMAREQPAREVETAENGDRKSTRLNSSHVAISYAVFCLKKKTALPGNYS